MSNVRLFSPALPQSFSDVFNQLRQISDVLQKIDLYPNNYLEFTDGDTTPTVKGRSTFFTSNTSATTITDFDDGVKGQSITVIFGDNNTTIDFTDTNLKGNAGADWSPGVNDHLTCKKGVNYWHCAIHDNESNIIEVIPPSLLSLTSYAPLAQNSITQWHAPIGGLTITSYAPAINQV